MEQWNSETNKARKRNLESKNTIDVGKSVIKNQGRQGCHFKNVNLSNTLITPEDQQKGFMAFLVHLQF